MVVLKAIIALGLAVTPVASAPTDTALGINCRGSGQCNALRACARDGLRYIAATLESAIEKGWGNITYEEGRRIACKAKCCAFFQSGASGTVDDALSHIQNLQNHGCKGCGSDPIHKGGYVSDGQLTVNYVHDPTRCEPFNLCPPTDNYGCDWEAGGWDPFAPPPTIPEGTKINCDDKKSRYGPEKECFLPLFCKVKRHIMQRIGLRVPPKVDMESQS